MVEMSRPIRLVPDQKSSGSASFMSAKTAHQIDAEAADWAGGVDRGPLTAGQEQAFQAWLSEDVRGMGAFGRMRALALSTERARLWARASTPVISRLSFPTVIPAGSCCGPAAPLQPRRWLERLRLGSCSVPARASGPARAK